MFAKLRVIANVVSQSAYELAEAKRNLSSRVGHDAANLEEISAVLEEGDATFNNMQDNMVAVLTSLLWRSPQAIQSCVDRSQTIAASAYKLLESTGKGESSITKNGRRLSADCHG